MSSRCSACSTHPAYERSAPDPLPGPDLIARPDNAILQVRPAPYRRARQEDALLYGPPFPPQTFPPNRHGPGEACSTAHNGLRAYKGVASHKAVGGRVDLGFVRYPHSTTAPLAGHLDRHPSRERVALGRPVGLERADVGPVEFPLVVPDELLPEPQDILFSVQFGYPILGGFPDML